MAKNVAAKPAQSTVILSAELTREDKESKNYAKFGSLKQENHLGNKPAVLLGNDGKVYLDKQLVNGTQRVRITVEAIEG